MKCDKCKWTVTALLVSRVRGVRVGGEEQGLKDERQGLGEKVMVEFNELMSQDNRTVVPLRRTLVTLINAH